MLLHHRILRALGLLFAMGLGACQSSPEPKKLLYPTAAEQGVSYYCRRPFYEPYNLNQRWTNMRPALLVVSAVQAVVYFENDEAQVLPLDFDDTIPSGSYRCPS